jgi:hypothetical protein
VQGPAYIYGSCGDTHIDIGLVRLLRCGIWLPTNARHARRSSLLLALRYRLTKTREDSSWRQRNTASQRCQRKHGTGSLRLSQHLLHSSLLLQLHLPQMLLLVGILMMVTALRMHMSQIWIYLRPLWVLGRLWCRRMLRRMLRQSRRTPTCWPRGRPSAHAIALDDQVYDIVRLRRVSPYIKGIGNGLVIVAQVAAEVEEALGFGERVRRDELLDALAQLRYGRIRLDAAQSKLIAAAGDLGAWWDFDLEGDGRWWFGRRHGGVAVLFDRSGATTFSSYRRVTMSSC